MAFESPIDLIAAGSKNMPLQNRVDAFGELIAIDARGTVLGNRGGRFHRDDRTLGRRRHASRTWICCRLEFNRRHREVWGKYYTELFFLDEVTAFSAGHRPCFECRRKDAETFAALWPDPPNPGRRARAADMDRILHSERLHGRLKRKHLMTENCVSFAFPIYRDGKTARVLLSRYIGTGKLREFWRPDISALQNCLRDRSETVPETVSETLFVVLHSITD